MDINKYILDSPIRKERCKSCGFQLRSFIISLLYNTEDFLIIYTFVRKAHSLLTMLDMADSMEGSTKL